MPLFKSLKQLAETQIDHWLRGQLLPLKPDTYTVSHKDFAAYRFVDLYHAVEELVAGRPALRGIESDNHEDLSSLIHTARPEWATRTINRSARSPWTTGPDEEVYLPVDRYWIYDLPDRAQSGSVVVRLKHKAYEELASLEIAARDADIGAALVREVTDSSIAESIYRNRMLALSFESGSRDEYGDVEKTERLRINFKTAAEVSREDFVIDDTVFETLQRNVIDLHVRREQLRRLGVPIRRGVLLYGPPGTGKTYACRYICGRLPETTRIVVAGTALNKVTQIFDLARTYQPSLVVLEDVDLVFAARDINLYSSALGDLLDQMDGLRPFEDIGVILTTNSIERMEAAIKDRPGRISQCIYFGPPAEALRAKYIAQYAKHYDYSAADENQLLSMSAGSTPAFIKEWIHRTVQFASEREAGDGETLALQTADFRAAFDEMRRFTDRRSERIIGFVGSD